MSQLKSGAILSYLNIFLSTAIGLVITPYIINKLGDSEYGLYILVGSFISYFMMDFGLNNTILRFTAKYRALKDKESENYFLSTIMRVYLTISAILFFVGILIYLNLDTIFANLTVQQLVDVKTMFLILIFNVVILLPGGAYTAICNAYERFNFPRILSITKYILRVVIIFSIFHFYASAVTLVIIDTFLNILFIILTYIYVKQKLEVNISIRKFQKSILRVIFSYTIWIFILAIISQLQWNAGQIVLGMKLDTISVAIYGVGIMLGSYYGAFSGAISTVFLPRATYMSIHSTKEQQQGMNNRLGHLNFIILMFIFTSFFLLGKQFIYLWIGNTYINSYYIAIIIMIAYTIPLIQTFANSLVEAYNKVKTKALVYLLSISSGIVLGFYLTSLYNEIGMALGICIGWLVGQIIMNILYHKVLGLNVINFYKVVLYNTIIPILIITFAFYQIYSSSQGNFINLFIKGAIYTLCYWLMAYFFMLNKTEKELLKIKRK